MRCFQWYFQLDIWQWWDLLGYWSDLERCFDDNRGFLKISKIKKKIYHCVKSVSIWSFSSSHFLAFRLNTESYSLFSLTAGKKQTGRTPNVNTFCAVYFSKKLDHWLQVNLLRGSHCYLVTVSIFSLKGFLVSCWLKIYLEKN